MQRAVEGVYDNGQITLKEKPILKHKVKVFVMFTEEEITTQPENRADLSPPKKMRGAWKNANNEDKNEIKNYFDNIRNECSINPRKYNN